MSTAKNQYNQEIRRRYAVQQAQSRIETLSNPKLSEIPLTEENVFGMLAHFFPVNHLIIRILKQSVSPVQVKSLLLSWGQVFKLQTVFPAYYTDREKIILLLNHYRFHRDVDKLLEFLYYSEEETQNCYWRLIIGLIFLDLYLDNLHSEYLLERSIYQLGEVDKMVHREDSRKAVGALLAFCYYMQKDFEKSSMCLKTEQPERFHDRFEDLLRKVA